MSKIKLKIGSSEYMVNYEYQPAQKGDLETEQIPESFELREIFEVLNDGGLSEDLFEFFPNCQIADIENKIAKEIKNCY